MPAADAVTPLVSVIIPERDEAAFIGPCLDAVLAQDYPPERVEVLVVDGMSTDGTRAIVEQRIGMHPGRRLRLLDNPRQIVPTALNIGLAESAGEVIIRVDGHCEIPPEYVSHLMRLLAETGADCAGGRIESVASSLMGRAIARAMSSPFGVGNASFRTGASRPGLVDTLAFGAYRREVFARVGVFDEELVRNQDDEFNFRLIQAGGRIWYDPSVVVRYYSRSSLASLWRQYYQYGYYKVRVMQKRRAVAAWRHLVPAAFVLALILSLLLALVLQQAWLALLVAGSYLLAVLAVSLLTARGSWRLFPLLPPAFAVLHISYGLGFLAGLLHYARKWSREPNAA